MDGVTQVRARVSQSTILGQLSDRMAALEAQSASRDRQLDAVARDTREARDGVRELATVLREQDLLAQIERLRSELGARVAVLEASQAKVAGAGWFLRLVKEWGPWAAGVMALLAVGYSEGRLG